MIEVNNNYTPPQLLSEQTRDELCEEVVLGSILSTNYVLNDIREFLDEDCFYNQKYKEIWKSIINVADKGDTPDIITVPADIASRDLKISQMEVMEISCKVSYGDEVVKYALRLRELSIRRKFWRLGQILVNAGIEETNDIDSVRTTIVENMTDMFRDAKGTVNLNSAIDSLVKNIIKNMEHGGVTTGTPTKFARIDEKGGLQGSDLIIVAGETSQGKTAMALSIIRGAISMDKKVAMYSMEMTKEQCAARILSAECGVPSNDILYNGNMTNDQLTIIDESRGRLKGENLFFDDNSTSNIETILSSIRSLKIKYDIDGVVIDYLQILNVNMKNTNKEQAMGDVCRRLKNLAKELNIWIMALSQLNRDSNNPVPNLNRLRDSGQIAEAADIVMFVYRPEYYNRTFPEPFTEVETKGYGMIDVAKGRNIGTFKFIVGFSNLTASFKDIDSNTEDIPFLSPEPEIVPF